jgi:hypothetical protein
MRRKDFLWGRPKQIPNIKVAAQQIRKHLEKLQLSTVFIATDAPSAGIALQFTYSMAQQPSKSFDHPEGFFI